MFSRGRMSLRGLVPLGLAFAVAACGSSASTAVSQSIGPAGPSTSAAPVSSAPAVALPSVDPILANVSPALAALPNYQFKVVIVGSPYGKVLGNSGMTGTVVNSPSFAAQFATSDMESIEIAGKVWTKNGTGWDLSPYATLSTNYDTFGPAVQLAHLFSPSTAAYFTAAGDETVNGVPTTHYQGTNQRALNFLSGIEGISGDATWAADIWVAKTGGYPVRFKIVASGAATFSLEIDISRANNPANVIHVPAS